MKVCFSVMLLLILFYGFANGEDPRFITARDHSVLISATTEKSPTPKITLKWKKNELARQYTVYRKMVGDKTWGSPLVQVDSSVDSFSDINVTVGTAYEYQVTALSYGRATFPKGNNKDTTFNLDFLGYGYICAGMEIPEIGNPGKILILVDETMAAALKFELTRLKEDLETEGWTVVIRQVPRTEKYSYDNVIINKQIIVEEYNKSPQNLTSLLLIGRVAVPYSGDLNPDAHGDHRGAWPADVYYGCMNEDRWTDTDVIDNNASREENRNGYGDGKMDPSDLGSDETVLQIGRIDFYNMPRFSNSETELLRKYLDKDHNYRTGQISYQKKGLIDNNFGIAEGFASSGWRNMGALVGPDNIYEADWFSTLQTDHYLWAYGCGGGYYQKADGIGTDSNFAYTQVNAVFTMLFGSYFGDWDSPNNFMRSAIASEPSILTCAWAGRPAWYFHHMAAGYPIGYSTRITQNNVSLYLPNYYFLNPTPGTYTFGRKQVHIALMGDPTLSMFMDTPTESIPKVSNVNIVQTGLGTIAITWQQPTGEIDIAGYNIYRRTDTDNNWTKLNVTRITGNSFIDENIVYDGKVYYMIRALKLQNFETGSFYNTGRGIIKDILATGIEDNPYKAFSLACSPNPAKEYVDIRLAAPGEARIFINIYDIKGNLVRSLESFGITGGEHSISWNLENSKGNRVPAGIYTIRVSAGGSVLSSKVAVLP